MRVIGLGLASRATAAEVRAALVAAGPADLLATLDSRAGHPALAGLGVPLRALPEQALHGVVTPSRSDRIFARFGCGSVAEAAALVASGGPLLTRRQTIGAVTWALAEGPGPIQNRTTPE